ncbi:putative cyclic nucleotide-binding protein [Rosa chinensis]|uniref:Putative cyclic nucleotide-binding protein n=1 Tax=Rosa chinensis TaxID=74649 RepID=A0A2P6SNU9_ROSCH|nr:putative cyclic nucleotide-binding protein [Rosa chinensis]
MLFSFLFLVWYYFHLFFGNMQTYLQSKTARSTEMRVKEREREHWMAFYTIPQHLKKRIREYRKDQWQENIGINMDNFLLSLPRDIRTDTKRYLCFGPGYSWSAIL